MRRKEEFPERALPPMKSHVTLQVAAPAALGSVTAEEAESAVALTPKKKETEGEPRSDAMEKRWFGR